MVTLSMTAQAQTNPPVPPTPQQVAAAVQRAERSQDLWATVNVCNTRRHPNTIGIRGQEPALGFASQLRMRFGVEYWTGNAFTPLRGLEESVALGSPGSGVHQSGAMFTFKPRAGTLRGSVTFEWRWHRQLIGRARRITSLHHHNADYGDPNGFSSAQCVIP